MRVAEHSGTSVTTVVLGLDRRLGGGGERGGVRKLARVRESGPSLAGKNGVQAAAAVAEERRSG